MPYSLNNLAIATGQTTKSLSSCAGTISGPIKMSDFMADSIVVNHGYEAVLNEWFYVEIMPQNAGSRYGRIIGNQSNIWVSGTCYIEVDLEPAPNGYIWIKFGEPGYQSFTIEYFDQYNSSLNYFVYSGDIYVTDTSGE